MKELEKKSEEDQLSEARSKLRLAAARASKQSAAEENAAPINWKS